MEKVEEMNVNDALDEKMVSNKVLLEQTMSYEKKIYDLEQLLDIAQSFCSTLDFSKLLESIIYICMAQMHVLGAEILVKDLVTNENLTLVTDSDFFVEGEKIKIATKSELVSTLIILSKPVTVFELENVLKDKSDLELIKKLNPTLIVPLIEKKRLNGVLLLQERIAIEDDTSYNEYEKTQIMSIANLAALAINNAALMEMSSTDMMTHLKLKYYFFNILTDSIDSAFLQGTNNSVLMLDIDFFKKFNDTYGHECGDFVLISVANLIKNNLRESDIACRYGGEEFTVLLNNTAKAEAMLVAERIRKEIEKTDFVYEGQHLHVTISLGVSVFDKEENLVNSANEFVKQADKALYESKQNGRNRVSFYDPTKEYDENSSQK